MNRQTLFGTASLAALVLCVGYALPAAAADGDVVTKVATGTVITPQSSVARAEDAGVRMHTNIKIFIPNGNLSAQNASPGGKYETPASLACVYGLTQKVKGCNPETLKTVATGGSRAIALVDAFDYPTAANDLSTYSAEYGLPAITDSNFQVVYASGTKPKQDKTGGWELEEGLDIEMAHALAPNAKIYLVEAASNSGKNLLQAEAVAASLVAAAGGGEVSNSWEGGEFSREDRTEKDFNVSSVVYFASAGDSPGVGWPSALHNVVGVGGTDINRDKNGDFMSQTAWSDTGGGPSAYLPRPDFQHRIKNIVGMVRGVPDISLVADPATGVWMYDTTPYNGQVLDWLVVGGTSVASPASAAIVNSAGSFYSSVKVELQHVYAAKARDKAFIDITSGTCGSGGKYSAMKGWDFCTGKGAPFGTADK
jgi:subtilase family serine protease